MYTVVAGIDSDKERARAQAETIADMPMDTEEIEVVLTHSFEENRSGASVAQVSSVQRAQSVLEDAEIDVILEEAGSDDPAATVLNFADEYDADLVAVAGRKRSPTKKVVFGSVSQEIILNTHRPVLVCE
ncbi:MAG: nucleotide-binding universal stress UspA family protein [Natronomonas sp.]|jgi:nucleotide-binding universal stress UspA family protein|uniref:universal stress protein n=1 Tax=Natronomonas sp. TaxID=2184060 RepID=UPI00398A103E